MPACDDTTSEVRIVGLVEYPGYLVGDDGSVWSVIKLRRRGVTKYGEPRRLKPNAQYRGHLTVDLGRGNKRFIHRIVLEAFVGPCPPGLECRHLDGDPGNNRLDNLAWGTRAENQADSVRHGTAFHLRPEWLQLPRNGRPVGSGHKLTAEQVEEIRRAVPPFGPARIRSRARAVIIAGLASRFGVSEGYIGMIARGTRRPKSA